MVTYIECCNWLVEAAVGGKWLSGHDEDVWCSRKNCERWDGMGEKKR